MSTSAGPRFGQPLSTSYQSAHNPFVSSAAGIAPPVISSNINNNPFSPVAAPPFGSSGGQAPAPATNYFPSLASNSFTGNQWAAGDFASSTAATAFPMVNSNNQDQHSKGSQRNRKTPFGPPGSAAAAGGSDSDDGMTDADDAAMNNNDDDNNNDVNNDPAKKLAKLHSLIEEKKKKLLAMNQQKQQDAAAATATTNNATSALNPQAHAFRPAATSSIGAVDTSALNPRANVFQPTLHPQASAIQVPADASASNNDNGFRQYKGYDANAADAPTRRHLPSDLLQQANSATTAASAAPAIAKTRETLETASSLVGTCQTMCPDEEILRREREGDIQLLERIDHNSIHPRDWTLRDTMVKRFRRSAADFKLDVPEWVRPPDVLERVCGYIEEWIMERDRQGPDPRYEHNNNKTPLPLDVYQFIWDRTRMVRKDFTLQNYVGGKSGHCDARAVRCHERMARWHCLCEHQLSHIPEFQSQQSQQNLQELGQTLKSLNQYYDDSMCRSLVEVADENGNEQRTGSDASKNHGCRESTIQGPPPVDYNGILVDPKASDQCFVGTPASSSHGTAEPEMRGLYILQTMMNEADSGLEITKFAFNLLQNRPEVYYSTPVQLALTIFKVSWLYTLVPPFSPHLPYVPLRCKDQERQQLRKVLQDPSFKLYSISVFMLDVQARASNAKRSDQGNVSSLWLKKER
jgi:SAC3/GANP family